MDKLREARAQAEEAVSCHVTQFKIKVWFVICSYRQSSQQFNGKKAVEGFMNFFFFILQNARHDRQRQMLENKVKALENELEMAKNRLQSLRAQAEERVRKTNEVTIFPFSGKVKTNCY